MARWAPPLFSEWARSGYDRLRSRATYAIPHMLLTTSDTTSGIRTAFLAWSRTHAQRVRCRELHRRLASTAKRDRSNIAEPCSAQIRAQRRSRSSGLEVRLGQCTTLRYRSRHLPAICLRELPLDGCGSRVSRRGEVHVNKVVCALDCGTRESGLDTAQMQAA